MTRKKLMILGGSRYAVPVVEAAHRLGVHVITADYLPNNAVHRVFNEYGNVFARRYFYPLLTAFPPYASSRNTCPVAQVLASRVLTLPTYHTLHIDDVRAIAEAVVALTQ